MNAADTAEPTVRAFGRWRLDASTGDLFDGVSTVRLEPRVARLLDYFLAHQDTLISRDELMAAVWDDRIVSDHAVNRCISILRQILSPEDKSAYIETVVRRGFISHFPPPLEAPTPAQAPETASPLLRKTRLWGLGALAVVLASVLFGALRMAGDSSAPGPVPVETPMVAVLPFISDGLSGDSHFFANGMHDDLLTQLAQLQSMRVISRTSVSEYRDSEMNIREIGRQLGADAILEGGVQQIGDQIRINVQLIDSGSDVHLWAEQYDRELTPTNIFDVQSEIARAIASAMHFTLTPQDAVRLEVIPTENMAAYRAYHEAMELRQSETVAAPAYIAALERAVALDPGFVRAWAELAGSLSYINLPRHDPQSIQRLEGILERVQTLAPQSSEALIAQSYYVYYILKDHDRAFELIRQAQELRPSDPQVLELQSWIQRRQGDIAGMIETLRQARRLDPRNAYWTTRLVTYLMLAHRYDQAVEEFENASLDNFRLAYLEKVLRVREHGQPGRLVDDLVVLQREYGAELDPFELWEAHIAARDFDGAAALLSRVSTAEPGSDAWTSFDVPDVDLAGVITDHFRDAHTGQLPVQAPAEPERRLARNRAQEVNYFEPNVYLAEAYISAAQGETAETERLVRTWFRGAVRDLAQRLNLRHNVCRALGMAAAASAAVECLRSAFEEPSWAHPFIEPFLPYYDSIRNDSQYVEFMAELARG